MKKSALMAALAATILSVSPMMAQAAAPTGKAAQSKATVPDVAEFDKQAAQLQEQMKTMQEQMEKIRQTQDPQERQNLLQEHWTTMQSGMGMMQGMWETGMMGCCGAGHMMGGPMMGWHGMGPYYSRLTPEQLKQRQYMMGQYMGMQQGMMNQMMQHQNYMWMQPTR